MKNNLPGTEFPKDNKVNAKNESGTFKINPRVFKVFIKIFAINHTHRIDIRKLKKLKV